MNFKTELQNELSKHSSRAKREQVASAVFWAMKEKGFELAIVNDRAFVQTENGFEVGKIYWMRRNNKQDLYEIVEA